MLYPLNIFPLPVPEVIDKLEYGQQIVPVAVALPVALCLDQGLLDARDQSLVPIGTKDE